MVPLLGQSTMFDTHKLSHCMGINNSVFFCFRMAAGVKVPVALQVNCGFARVAMLELSRVPTGQSRANLDKEAYFK